MPDKVSSCKDGELPLVLTVAEAGEALRIGRTAAYSIVRCGKLRSIRVGRTIRVPRDAIAEFLRAQRGCGRSLLPHPHFINRLMHFKGGKNGEKE